MPRRADYKDSGIRELDCASFNGQGDRSGTSYAVGWRARIVHREHPKPRADCFHGLQSTGVCYKGDFCDHFMFRHLHEILRRHRRCSHKPILEWLRSAMCVTHFDESHYRHGAYHLARMDDGKGELSGHTFKRCNPCGEILGFYQRLNRYNITHGIFAQQVSSSWLYRAWSFRRTRGVNRITLHDSDTESPDWNKRRKRDDWDEDDRPRRFELNQMIREMDQLSLVV